MQFSMSDNHEETHVTMFRTGLEFRRAFTGLLSSRPSNVSNAIGVLASHSIECFLKSYLMKTNPNGNIRSVGHNLKRGLNRSKSTGFSIKSDSEDVINSLNSTFNRMLSRYPKNNTGNVYPNRNRISDTLKELVIEVGTIVGMDEDGNFTE